MCLNIVYAVFLPCKCRGNGVCDKGVCHCDDGYVLLTTSGKDQGECIKGRSVAAMERCYRKGTDVQYCDLHNKLICRSGICHCVGSYYLNYKTGQCEPIKEYLQNNGLSEYHVKPGEYCRDEGDCIEGLECKNFTCACPGFCNYQKNIETCDCGHEGAAIGPIITGFFLGFFIVVGWSRRIYSTIKTFNSKSSQAGPVAEVPEESSITTYALSPLGPSTNTTPPSAPVLSGQLSSPSRGGGTESPFAPPTAPLSQPASGAHSFPNPGDSFCPHYPADEPPPYSSLPLSVTAPYQGLHDPPAVNPFSMPYPASPLGTSPAGRRVSPSAPVQADFNAPLDPTQLPYSLDPGAASAKPSEPNPPYPSG